MEKKGKLELTWVGKYEDDEELEPRILVEDKEKSQTEETMTEEEIKAMQEENAKLKSELEAKEKMLSNIQLALV